jgi:hypothetical protein
VATNYPATSTGRRAALARWFVNPQNPLTARVAVNHIWLRHFGQAMVPTVTDFGNKGRAPSHPQLLDWLAATFMENGQWSMVNGQWKYQLSPIDHQPSTINHSSAWSMKKLHRLIVTSSAYRTASTPDAANAKIDPDNVYLWRMNSRRMEAETVRDNVLYASGSLDSTMGGPEVDHTQGLTSKRRSLYLRIAAEKEVEFLKVFDSPNVNECYERKPTVMPQQALALANSELTLREARHLARALFSQVGADAAKFTTEAFLRILARRPTSQELKLCADFLTEQTKRLSEQKSPPADSALRARENLVLVLFNHNDFVTVR